MPLKFRLKGLAETFVDNVSCDCCGNQGGEDGDEGFSTDMSRVTLDGIVAVIECTHCGHIFVPKEQKLGVISLRKLRQAVENDSKVTGTPVLSGLDEVALDVEKLNAIRDDHIQ